MKLKIPVEIASSLSPSAEHLVDREVMRVCRAAMASRENDVPKAQPEGSVW